VATSASQTGFGQLFMKPKGGKTPRTVSAALRSANADTCTRSRDNAVNPILIKTPLNRLLVNIGLTISCSLLLSCSELRKKTAEPMSEGHIQQSQKAVTKDDIPAALNLAPVLPKPNPMRNEPLHTVVVHNVPVTELLFSLARDADLNLDINENVDNRITLNAVNQTLPAILARIADASGLYIENKNQVLIVRKDTPFLRNYRIDYLNMARSSTSGVSVSSQISSTGQGATATGTSGDNNSSTSVSNLSEHSFWKTLRSNILSIIAPPPVPVAPLAPADTAAPSAGGPLAALSALGGGQSAAEAPAPTAAPAAAPVDDEDNDNIMVNQESGIIGVRATYKQHQDIQAFLDEVLNSARRQVLIEATIAEVKLSDRYQAGIDWAALNDNIESSTGVVQEFNDISLRTPPAFALTLFDADTNGQAVQSTLRALGTFGDVRIMSSPKVMALNNQTALLKVVDNLIYFTTEVNIDNSGDSGALTTFETTVNSVPVGFVMSVTPYINDQDSVTLNVRPTISRVVDKVRDPNPSLVQVDVFNEIPVIQVRELESMLKVGSGDIAIIGGLMQDDVNNVSKGVPLLSRIPYLGALFRYDDDKSEKTELVIFIKPIVIHHASLQGDLNEYSRYLPHNNDER
jgi:MSHA type pilus biogenesis protein MshL